MATKLRNETKIMTTVKMSDGAIIDITTLNSDKHVGGRTSANFVLVFKAELTGSLLQGYGSTPDKAVADLYREIRNKKRREMEAGLDL